ncbi:MAG: BlaI/MecI/CopY family transcriptional regulator [Bacteroidales bacterium]|nr:BlaI/MecI/CopY family transcriptional regulator [Bacteroidales bacterium]
MKELTKAEEQVMQVIWSIGSGFANEIMAAYPEPKPAYNTVLTIIRILEKKGFVKHQTFCKANRYEPAISKEEYSQNYLGSVVERYFNNSYLDLVSAFAKKENFSVEELEELKKILDENGLLRADRNDAKDNA